MNSLRTVHTILKKCSLFLCSLLLLNSCASAPINETTTNTEPVIKDTAETITLMFTGDLLLDRGVREVIKRKNTDYLFSGIKEELRNSDFVITNLECPVTEIRSAAHKKFVFRGDTSALSALRNNHITHACMANNHSMDQGREGIRDTYKNLKKYSISPLGFGNTQEEALQPHLISYKGQNIALFSSVMLRLENWSYFSDSAGVCQASAEELTEKISTYKKQNPKHRLVVVLHWGIEYQPHPDLEQRKNAHAFIDAGADAIIGHHPHIVQDHEVYKGKHIFYSLGNFIFDALRKEGQRGELVKLEILNDSIKAIEIPIKIEGCRPLTVLSP